MSDNIPFHIQAEIMIRLPVESLMRFRSVSKSWKSLIHSPKFIRDHSSCRHQSQHRLLVKYQDSDGPHYVSIVDDDTFPQRKFSITSAPLPPPRFKLPIIGGSSSQGLFCFYKHHAFRNDNSETTMAVIWNPTLGKSVDIVVPKVQQYETVVGFGVCPHTCDPKLVKISYLNDPSSVDSIISIPRKVEVFSLSTRAWKSLSINLPPKSIRFGWKHVDIDGVIYWLADDKVNVDAEHPVNYLIMSFDLTSEEFTQVYLPDKLAHALSLSISKLRESLVVLNCIFEDGKPAYEVWIMNNDDPKSFTHVFSIKTQDARLRAALGFRKSGEPVIEMIEDDDDGHFSLFVYKSYSEHINFGITGYASKFFVGSYMETLLLLDQ